MLLNFQFVLSPLPPTHIYTRLHLPFRTKCAECGHSCGAGLPSTVRVSETPLSCIQHKGGSTLSLDTPRPPIHRTIFILKTRQMATNLLNVTNGLVATWTFKCSHVPIGSSRLPSYKMTISFMERVALVIFNNPDLPVFCSNVPEVSPHLSDAEED